MPTDADLQAWLSGLNHWLAAFGQAGLPAWLPPTAVVGVALLAIRAVARQRRAWLFGFLLGWLAGTGDWTQLAPWLAMLWRSGGLP